jgi:uncharacterized membrane protein YfcA
MEIHPWLPIFGFLAGAVDAIAGGGGLIQLPALILLQPQLSLATILGCNKLSSISGTSYALFHYNNNLSILWRKLYGGIIAAFIGSLAGAKVALLLTKEVFTPYIIVALILVFLFTLVKKDIHPIQGAIPFSEWAMITFCFIIGFYDGCIGPGTGSFLIAGMLILLRLDFLEASAHSKVINLTTNIAALALFISTGSMAWGVAIPLAISNVIGSMVGSRLAIYKGSKWVKAIFRIVIIGMLCKMIYQYL